MVHHLQQHIEQIRVRFFNLVEQQNTMRVLVNAIGQQAALVIADIAGRRAKQARYGMTLHIFRHIKAQQFYSHSGSQLPRHFGFADTGRAGEQIAANRLFSFAQTGTRQFYGSSQRSNRFVLPEHHTLQRDIEAFQLLRIVFGDGFRRYPRHCGNGRLNIFHADRFFSLRCGQQHLRRTDFVNHVNRFIRQFTVSHIAR